MKTLSSRKALLAAAAVVSLAAAAATYAALAAPDAQTRLSQLGEPYQTSVTVALARPVADRVYSGPSAAGRPIVVLDPGHGGHDPGAAAVSGDFTEEALTLALARELRDALVERGRVRVAMTREDDRYLSLEDRAAVARRLDASLFLSLHMDSAPNPLARGASVYSLSDVASDAETDRFARAENARGGAAEEAGDVVEATLSELSLRSQMAASADLAERLVRKAAGRIELRPEPHRFAAFHVLRNSGTAAALFEAGYLSNEEDAVLLGSPEYRARIVTALAQAVETDVATRARR